MASRTDHELVRLCLDGQEAAWESLVRRYQRLVYHFPNDARLEPEDCDEVFQETFMATYRGLAKLLEVDAVDQWIATVAKRTTWKVVQRNRKHPGESMIEPYDVEDPELIAEELVARKVAQSRIRQAFTKLDERCRVLLHLLFYEYDSSDYDLIAKKAGMARGSIGPIRQRCLLKLKKALEGLGIDEKVVSEWVR